MTDETNMSETVAQAYIAACEAPTAADAARYLARLRQIHYQIRQCARDLEWLRALVDGDGGNSEKDRYIDAVGRLNYAELLVPHEARGE